MSRFDNKKPSKILVSLVAIVILILVVMLGWLLWPSQPSQVDAVSSPSPSVSSPPPSPEPTKAVEPTKEPEAPVVEEPVVEEPVVEAPVEVFVTAEEITPIVEAPAPVAEVIEPAPVAEVPVAEVPVSGVYSSPNHAMWESIAQCESGGNWDIQTGNGYYGGLQFLPSSWAAAGGVGNPADASKEEQMRIADNLLAMQGPGAWGCYGK